MGNGRAAAVADDAHRYLEQVAAEPATHTVNTSSTTCASSPYLADRRTTPRWLRCADLRRDTHRGLQDAGWHHRHPTHRRTAEPGQHQERADRPAAASSTGSPNGTTRRADHGRCCSPATCPSSTSRCPGSSTTPPPPSCCAPPAPTPTRSSRLDRRAARPHRDAQGRTARPHRRRRRADRLRLLAARSRSASCTTTATSRCTRSSRTLLDDWLATPARRAALEPVFIERGRPITDRRVDPRSPTSPTPPASATSPPTNSATPWPPRPSTAA